MKIEIYDEKRIDGEWVETCETLEVPEKFAVCPRCEGKGTHTNPNIDGNGITSEEMHELGDEFREDYLKGVYDVRCERCKGLRVITVVDYDRLDAETAQRVKASLEAQARAEWEIDAAMEAERRMGA